MLAADKLIHNPRLYATFLLWLLSELFEELPEAGDPEKPRMVFFFDKAEAEATGKNLLRSMSTTPGREIMRGIPGVNKKSLLRGLLHFCNKPVLKTISQNAAGRTSHSMFNMGWLQRKGPSSEFCLAL